MERANSNYLKKPYLISLIVLALTGLGFQQQTKRLPKEPLLLLLE